MSIYFHGPIDVRGNVANWIVSCFDIKSEKLKHHILWEMILVTLTVLVILINLGDTLFERSFSQTQPHSKP